MPPDEISTLTPVPLSPVPEHQNPPENSYKFFFVHPPSWLHTDMLPALIRSEVPAYVTANHQLIPEICKSHPGSVLYINAERNGGSERADWLDLFAGWENILREFRMTVVFLDRGLTATRQAEIRKPGIPIAFVELNQSPRNIFNIIYTMAVKLNEKSRRKAIRVGCEQVGLTPSWNVQINGHKVRGHIRDISSSGMAAYFPPEARAYISEGGELRDIQLQLKGSPVIVHATIAALRDHEGKNLMIVLFRWGDDKRSKEHIHQYIYQRLQDELADLLG